MLAVLVAGAIFANPAYYPEGARRRGEEGITRVQLDVGADGRPDMCRATQSSGSTELDASACELINARMRYRPSFDARGVAVRSTHMQSVRWQLKGDPEEERQGRSVLALLAVVMTGFLVYLPMSILHGVQTGDFWAFEKAGRVSLLRAAARAQNPVLYWSAIMARVVALLLLSMAMAQVIALMSPANVRISTPPR